MLVAGSLDATLWAVLFTASAAEEKGGRMRREGRKDEKRREEG
jgi:hypothetical protein